MAQSAGVKRRLAVSNRSPEISLTGVGRNQQDHLLGAGTVYQASQPLPVSRFQHGEGMQYLRTDSQLRAPDLLLMFVTLPYASFALPRPPGNGYTILPCIMQPKSKGTMRLRSNRPTDTPIIDPNYFADPDDSRTLIQGFEIAREIGAHAELAQWRQREVYPAQRWQTSASRIEFVQQAASTFFHPVGTCSMGALEDSVVDGSLRVRGTLNLRVIDASVIPRIPSAPINAAVMAVAEKAVDMILANT